MNDHETRIQELEKRSEVYLNQIRDLKIQVRSLEQQLRDARGN